MKIVVLILLFSLTYRIGFAQNKLTDSLTHQLGIAKYDTSRVMIMSELCYEYRYSHPDTAIIYGQQALDLAQHIQYSNGEASALSSIGFVYRGLGDLQQSLSLQQKALSIAEQNIKSNETAKALFGIGATYVDLKDYFRSLTNFKKALSIYQLNNNKKAIAIMWVNIGNVYEKMNHLDSALYFTKKGNMLISELRLLSEKSYALRVLSNIYIKSNKLDLALNTARMGVNVATHQENFRDQGFCNYLIAEIYKIRNQKDSCIYYAKAALHYAQICNYKLVIIETSMILAELYEPKYTKEALYYYKIAKTANDEMFGATKILGLQKTMAEEKERQNNIEAKRIAKENLLKQYGLLIGLGMLLFIAFILYRNNQKEKKAKNQLQEKNELIEQTLANLKATQTQLVQKEKLASLGELTAGIAHEIQNPLNFVNNFSELSIELAQELKEEIEKPELDTELISELVSDLNQNQEKINYHGKRASSIVKGMLEHSKASTGARELTDINQLTDEYIRLAYHGLRAKDKNFKVDYELIVGENLPLINVVPQEIGRVLLNLITNAFYAVNERAKLREVEYQPNVTVMTKTTGNQVEICVTDNGTGIPADVLPKIFQPFFTTKPTGQGTGLGLSLAYDIVTKGHGGTIKVETVEGKGTTFTIMLLVA